MVQLLHNQLMADNKMEQLTHLLASLEITHWFMLGVVAVLVTSLVLYRQQRKQFQSQAVTMQSLQRDLRALANAAVGVGGRVMELERQQRKQPQVVPAQQSVASVQPITPAEVYPLSNQPYEQAIQMVHSGASVDDIVNVCGLSRSEAELISMMHRLDKAS